MLNIEYTNQFKRDLKLSKRQHKNLNSLQEIMQIIQLEKKINPTFRDHPLTGNWQGYRELHIEPNWLLIYQIVAKTNTVIFVRVGTHADLFK